MKVRRESKRGSAPALLALQVSNQKTEYFSDDPNNWSSVQQTA